MRELLSPWNFSSDGECLCCFWWAPQTTPEFILVKTHSGPQDGLRMGLALPDCSPRDQKIRALIYMESARPPGRRGLLETEFTHMAKGSTNEGFK